MAKLKHVITVWNSDSSSFEEKLGILWNARRLRQLGSKQQMVLLFLAGFSELPASYVRQLRSSNYQVLDVEKKYLKLATAFASLNQFGEYEKKCFLRWLVLEKLFPDHPLIHYDADVVFNALPEEIESVVSGKTAVLQGCPAFTSIAQKHWFASYRRQLQDFSQHTKSYSRTAWSRRKGWEISQRKKWAGSRFRKIISSDQDLLSHLIHTDQIPQALPTEFSKSNLVFFENPLYIHEQVRNLSLPLQYRRQDELDYVNDHKVAFWHMQTDFVHYLNLHLKRGWLNHFSANPNPLVAHPLQIRFWNAVGLLRGQPDLSRRSLYRVFFEEQDFGGVLSASSFWQPGVFK